MSKIYDNHLQMIELENDAEFNAWQDEQIALAQDAFFSMEDESDMEDMEDNKAKKFAELLVEIEL